ncbi:MAG: hypothetical protein GXP49_01710 [Deltaproteobacteria bacterium]|nr:hypothetical protein [Deltaproteobacteria bacterium]
MNRIHGEYLTVTAPGKLMLAGEYAVVLGGDAVVVAVNRNACVTLGRDITGVGGRKMGSRLSRVAAGLAVEQCGIDPVPGPIEVDTSAMYIHGQKLGLGSSAATTAGVCGAVFQWAGISCGSKKSRKRIFECAFKAQSIVQGERGSGADVAASVYGGLFSYKRPEGGEPAVTRLPMDGLPPMSVVWTGRPSNTPYMLRRFWLWVESMPRGEVAGALDCISNSARRLASAVCEGDEKVVLDAYRDCADAYMSLGIKSGMPLMECTTPKLLDLVAMHGGVYKPSGAGAGDLGVALFTDTDHRDAFEEEARKAGMLVLDLEPSRAGVEAGTRKNVNRAGRVWDRDGNRNAEEHY